MTRFSLSRIRIIARLVSDRGEFTTAELDQWMATHRVAVCRKTLRRDLNTLRADLGYELEYSFARGTWRGSPPKERVL